MDAADYRKRAQHLRAAAGRMVFERTRAQLRDLAAQYDDLAEQAAQLALEAGDQPTKRPGSHASI